MDYHHLALSSKNARYDANFGNHVHSIFMKEVVSKTVVSVIVKLKVNAQVQIVWSQTFLSSSDYSGDVWRIGSTASFSAF